MIFKMKGSVPPMITPFSQDGEVDYKGLASLVEFLRDQVDGLFINGSYGSGALMTVEERKKVAEVTLRSVAGRIPVIVHTGSTNNRDTVELSRHARAAGAQAVSAVGPYYFKHNDDSICYFFEDILKSVGPDFPVYVYNNPQFQGYPMGLPLLRRLKHMGVRGMKDATFDILLHATYQRTLKDEAFDVVLGTEAMWLSARALGCEGFVPGLANAFPEIVHRMCREGLANDFEACRGTQFEVNRMREVMYLAQSTQLAIYAMLEIRGVLTAYPRAPFMPAGESEKKSIREELVKLGAL